MKPVLFAVLGDVHHHLGLAVEGLTRLEDELGRPIAQTFSVGDFGLFLTEPDWNYLTGPKKYRNPAESAGITQAWQRWRWPLSMIAGNHEPFSRLRNWEPGYFSFKLEYTNAGELPHSIPGLRVLGLSGIYHPEETDFVSPVERQNRKLPRAATWLELVRLVERGAASRNRLTYYKESEVELLKWAKRQPDLLLTHDWPCEPEGIRRSYPRRPEGELVSRLEPAFVCCGHHHRAAQFKLGRSSVVALNIIATPEALPAHRISPGWAAVFEWDGFTVSLLKTWPE